MCKLTEQEVNDHLNFIIKNAPYHYFPIKRKSNANVSNVSNDNLCPICAGDTVKKYLLTSSYNYCNHCKK